MAVDGKFHRKSEDTNVALGLISLDHRPQTGSKWAGGVASVTRLIDIDLREARVELLSRRRSWSALSPYIHFVVRVGSLRVLRPNRHR